MILRMYTLSLEPVCPLRFSVHELRMFLNKKLLEYTSLQKENTSGYIYRYPVLQCKAVKDDLIVMGISQGADCLSELSRDRMVLATGESSCRITARDKEIRSEMFGSTTTTSTYEFLTPWVALNQQHAKKFYDLIGKPQRDAFMRELLATQLQTLAKSSDCGIDVPLLCEVKVRFERERVDRENVMVFHGKVRTNLRIPDFLGIGRLVSQGYGTIKQSAKSPDTPAGES